MSFSFRVRYRKSCLESGICPACGGELITRSSRKITRHFSQIYKICKACSKKTKVEISITPVYPSLLQSEREIRADYSRWHVVGNLDLIKEAFMSRDEVLAGEVKRLQSELKSAKARLQKNAASVTTDAAFFLSHDTVVSVNRVNAG